VNRRDFLRRGSLLVAGGLVTAETLERLDWQRFRRIYAAGDLRADMARIEVRALTGFELYGRLLDGSVVRHDLNDVRQELLATALVPMRDLSRGTRLTIPSSPRIVSVPIVTLKCGDLTQSTEVAMSSSVMCGDLLTVDLQVSGLRC
jgi:hypothetical protein